MRVPIMAIDPDLHGAVALVLPDGTAEVYDTPVTEYKGPDGKKRYRYVLKDMAALIAKIKKRYPNVFAVIEEQRAYGTKDYIQALVSLLTGYGAWQMALTIMAVPYDIVSVLDWKFAQFGAREAPKAVSVELARKRHPELYKELTYKKHGRADALNMAHYAKEQMEVWNR